MSSVQIEITPATVGMRSVKGDSEPFTVTVLEDNVAISWTGCSVKMQLRYPSNNNIAVTLNSGTEITLSAGGIATVATDTINALEVGDYRYDIQLTRANGKKRTLLSGIYSILYEATT